MESKRLRYVRNSVEEVLCSDFWDDKGGLVDDGGSGDLGGQHGGGKRGQAKLVSYVTILFGDARL
jgi:hypothetical protein